MKYLLFAIVFAFTSGLQAADPDYRSFFSHPDAQITIGIGRAHSKSIPYKNHSIPKTLREIPLFQNGFGTSGDLPNAFNVQWSFIKKTEHGDLYLFAVEKDKVLVKAFPALYAGSAIIAYDHDVIQVAIEPHNDEK